MNRNSPTSLADHRVEVLLVDADADVLHRLDTRFRRAGLHPILATNALEALDRMADHPSCRRILTEFTLPGLSGEAWMDLLRTRCEGWSVVVVSARDADPGHFVLSPKPLDVENLIQHFRRVPVRTVAEVRRRAAS